MLYGIVNYKNEKYIFKLEDDILYLESINDLEGKFIYPNWFVNPPIFSGEFISGINAENGNILWIKTIKAPASFKNTRLEIRIEFYIEISENVNINRIVMMGNEIDYIYDISNGIEKYQFDENGMALCKTKRTENTTSNIETFTIGEKTIEINFGINKAIKPRSSQPMLLQSFISLTFEETNDYNFIYHLYLLIKKFLAYLCYRQSINITNIDLYTKDSEGKYKYIGDFYYVNYDIKVENEKIVKDRNIQYDAVKGQIGNILQNIENKNLYLRHIPKSYKDSKTLDCSKFIMVTAAFEHLFKDLYPNGINHSPKTINAFNEIKKSLQEKVDTTTGEIKKQYRYLLKIVGSDSLSQKIVQVGKDYDNLIGDIGRYLYSLNNMEKKFNYKEIGCRIEKKRNDYAHGNLNDDFDDITFAAIIFMERVVYLLQLSLYHIDYNTIIKQIERLFG